MEEALFELYQELKRLEAVCAKQTVLLQKLAAKKEPVFGIPISVPIQCTDGGSTEPSESPFSRLEAAKTLNSALFNPVAPRLQESASILEQTQGTDVLSEFAFSHLSTGMNSRGNGMADSTTAFPCQHPPEDAMGKKADFDAWFNNKAFPVSNAEEEKSSAGPTFQEFAALNTAAVDSSIASLDLYRAPPDLPIGNASIQDSSSAESRVPIEIRGPTQTCWTPGPMLEACLLVHSGEWDPEAAQDIQTSDLRRIVFLSGAAEQGDSLKDPVAHAE